jgi:hypothetical protein
MKKIIMSFIFMALLGCATFAPPPPPQWNPINETSEAEYTPYLAGGTGSVSGQALMTQEDGPVVTAAGQKVTLDPATSVGNEWWSKVGPFWAPHYGTPPPSPNFQKSRKTTVADRDGKFTFSGLAAGKYYVRTLVTWEVRIRCCFQTRGGAVGKLIEVHNGKTTDAILTELE